MRQMAKFAVFGALSVFSFVTSAQDATSPPQVAHYETPGYLEPTHPLGCIAPDQIRNGYTPADLYPAVAECIKQDRDEDGIILFVVAGAYGNYDTLRVADKSAHDAPMLLRMQAFTPVGVERKKQFDGKIIAFLQDETRHIDLCRRLLHLGPPTYFPRYMTQHGMDAFTNPDAASQIESLDPATSWLRVLKDYTNCDFVTSEPS